MHRLLGHVVGTLHFPFGTPVVMFLCPVFSTSAIPIKAAGSHSILSPTRSSPLFLHPLGPLLNQSLNRPGLFICNSLERGVPAFPMASLQEGEIMFSRPSPPTPHTPSVQLRASSYLSAHFDMDKHLKPRSTPLKHLRQFHKVFVPRSFSFNFCISLSL